MLPKIQVHRPSGIVPKVSVRKRTTIDYRPSWLLVALPALAAVKALRSKTSSGAKHADVPQGEQMEGAEPYGEPDSAARRRPVIVLVSAVRRRRRPEVRDETMASSRP